MSARNATQQKVTFSLSAPDARNVALVGSFGEWEQHPIAMRRLKSGQWKATVALPQGQHEYRFLVDGQWRDDPACAERVINSFGTENCLRTVS